MKRRNFILSILFYVSLVCIYTNIIQKVYNNNHYGGNDGHYKYKSLRNRHLTTPDNGNDFKRFHDPKVDHKTRLEPLDIKSHTDLSRLFYNMRKEQSIRNGNRTLSVLSFGTSMTWGAGLDLLLSNTPIDHQTEEDGGKDASSTSSDAENLNEKKRHMYTYPGLLAGSNAKNLALRAQGPHYPAMCTQSMVGSSKNHPYDVITLEFFFGTSPTLEMLTQRLRDRFPYAIIILIRHWRMNEVWYHEDKDTGKVLRLGDWMKLNGLYQEGGGNAADNGEETAVDTGGYIMDDNLLKVLTNTTKQDEWFFKDDSKATRESTQDQDNIYKKMKDNGVYLLDVMPERSNFFKAAELYGGLILPDLAHWTVKGHVFVATRILQLLHDIQYVPSSKHFREEPQRLIGPWTQQDKCLTWLSKPNVIQNQISPSPKSDSNVVIHDESLTHQDPPIITQYHGLELNKWGSYKWGEKYALQLDPYQSLGYMKINNPFNKKMFCFVSYMTTGIEHTYIDADSWIVKDIKDETESSNPTKIRLNPYVNSHKGQNVHIVITQEIGIIPKGESYIMFSPDKQQQDKKNIQGLKIVGIVISDGNIHFMKMEDKQISIAEEKTQ